MEAVVVHNYRGDLTVTAGDVIQVMSMVVILNSSSPHRHFYPAEFNGEAGLLPVGILAIRPEDFYVGKLSRDEADNFLHQEEIGTFLIRDDEDRPGNFILSVSRIWRTVHYPILRDDSGAFFLREENKFSSLNKLVEFEKQLSKFRAHKSAYIKEELLVGSVRQPYEARIAREVSVEKGEKVAYELDLHYYDGFTKVTKTDGSKGFVPLELIESLDFMNDVKDDDY